LNLSKNVPCKTNTENNDRHSYTTLRRWRCASYYIRP